MKQEVTITTYSRMFTDAHTHLNISPLYEERPHHIQEFIQCDGVWLSIIWTDHDNSMKAIQIVQKTRALFPHLSLGATIGLHPECVWYHYKEHISRDEWLSQSLQSLEQLIESYATNIIAIGEIGTDMHREEYRPFHQQQLILFDAQCKLARTYQLPIVIHSRSDFQGSMEILKNYPDLTIYFHCRWYTSNEIVQLTKLLPQTFCHKSTRGFIGFCGNITYPKAHDLRDSLISCKDHGIPFLIETDAPFLAAQAIRGQTNTPALIHHTYEYISDYLHIPLSTLQLQVYNNWKQLYQISK